MVEKGWEEEDNGCPKWEAGRVKRTVAQTENK